MATKQKDQPKAADVAPDTTPAQQVAEDAGKAVESQAEAPAPLERRRTVPVAPTGLLPALAASTIERIRVQLQAAVFARELHPVVQAQIAIEAQPTLHQHPAALAYRAEAIEYVTEKVERLRGEAE